MRGKNTLNCIYLKGHRQEVFQNSENNHLCSLFLRVTSWKIEIEIRLPKTSQLTIQEPSLCLLDCASSGHLEMRGIHLCFAPAVSLFLVGHICVAQIIGPTNISESKGLVTDTENKNIQHQKY